MLDANLVCWSCGESLAEEPLPLSRTAECRHCRAELHVCRMCRHYDPRVPGRCREERADPPQDRDRANFCDWFEASAGAWKPQEPRRDPEAEAELAALFGEAPGDTPLEASREPEDPLAAARKLFRND
jgi:hypothetical protein